MSIYKKQSEDPKEFGSAEEFLKYYDNNRKDIDATHTRSLNLKYKINGHTIGRKQGKLILYPTNKIGNEIINDATASNSDSDLKQMYEQLKSGLLDLNERLKKLESLITPQSNFQLYCHK